MLVIGLDNISGWRQVIYFEIWFLVIKVEARNLEDQVFLNRFHAPKYLPTVKITPRCGSLVGAPC